MIIIEISFKVKHVHLGIEKCKEMEEANREREKNARRYKAVIVLAC